MNPLPVAKKKSQSSGSNLNSYEEDDFDSSASSSHLPVRSKSPPKTIGVKAASLKSSDIKDSFTSDSAALSRDFGLEQAIKEQAAQREKEAAAAKQANPVATTYKAPVKVIEPSEHTEEDDDDSMDQSASQSASITKHK